MPTPQVSKSNSFLSFLGILGAFSIFALLLFIAYLPNRPAPVDTDIVAQRQANADEARIAGMKKITSYEMIDAQAGVARIPVDQAMLLTVAAYQQGGADEAEPEAASAE